VITPLFPIHFTPLLHALHLSYRVMMAGVPLLIVGFAWGAYILRESDFDLYHHNNSAPPAAGDEER
jgi:uncharacterized BrkB/YihY/UPF0761 family membrane protein